MLGRDETEAEAVERRFGPCTATIRMVAVLPHRVRIQIVALQCRADAALFLRAGDPGKRESVAEEVAAEGRTIMERLHALSRRGYVPLLGERNQEGADDVIRLIDHSRVEPGAWLRGRIKRHVAVASLLPGETRRRSKFALRRPVLSGPVDLADLVRNSESQVILGFQWDDSARPIQWCRSSWGRTTRSMPHHSLIPVKRVSKMTAKQTILSQKLLRETNFAHWVA